MQQMVLESLSPFVSASRESISHVWSPSEDLGGIVLSHTGLAVCCSAVAVLKVSTTSALGSISHVQILSPPCMSWYHCPLLCPVSLLHIYLVCIVDRTKN